MCVSPSKSTLWNPHSWKRVKSHTDTKQAVCLLPTVPKAETGQRYTHWVFYHEIMERARQLACKKNGSFRKLRLALHYLCTATQVSFIRTQQTLGNQPKPQASPSIRKTQALRSQTAELPSLRSQRSPSLAIQTFFRTIILHMLGLSRTPLILKHILENKRKVCMYMCGVGKLTNHL